MVVCDTPYAYITYSSQSEVLSIKWKDRPSLEQFKNVYWQGLQFVKAHPEIRFYCVDISLIGPFDQEQELWLNWEFCPQVLDCIQTNIFAAVIFSEEHFNALVNNYVAPSLLPIHGFIQLNYFTDAVEAHDWLAYTQRSQGFALAAKS
ncbi:hypothetical protein H9Q13_02060 [Pontibacter sp. JH31]|uniref:STAS/SEC14 domain-containing protein n=1 Tax=Pontibacter aquaedesilientis TaxID=2766980 RepID=A0ABR7XEY1_9BACT|nr:hypothetical protein [Pontibacter aquaedesilientis]MBD1395936.1 hypothetical protein [Pontibacter aquaedesilientis]